MTQPKATQFPKDFPIFNKKLPHTVWFETNGFTHSDAKLATKRQQPLIEWLRNNGVAEYKFYSYCLAFKNESDALMCYMRFK